jgi:ubiquinone/menaquinone biosynthesis C-methylase UbiE
MSEKHSGLGISQYFGTRLVELAGLQEGDRVLDVGCGRGASLFPAVKRVGTQGHVTGIDVDKDDVETTAERIVEGKVANASVHRMDATDMTFDDAAFDYVIGGFVFPYLIDQETKSLHRETLRVLKDGGKVVLSSWEVMEDADLMIANLQHYLPEVPREKFCVYSRVPPKELEAALTQANLHQVSSILESAEFHYRNKEHWWQDMQLRTWKPFYDTLGAEEAERLEEFKETGYQRILTHRRTEGTSFTVSVHFVFGTKIE